MASAARSAAAILPRLLAANERLLAGRLLDADDEEALATSFFGLATLNDAQLLLANNKFCVALLRLLGTALRHVDKELVGLNAPDGAARHGGGHTRVGVHTTMLAYKLLHPLSRSPSPPSLDWAFRLLRTQTLQCYARQLAAAVEAIRSPDVSDVSLGHCGVTIDGAAALTVVLVEAASLWSSTNKAVEANAGAAGTEEGRQAQPAQHNRQHLPLRQQQQQRQEQQQRQQLQRARAFALELLAALLDSGVLEHAARAALHLHLAAVARGMPMQAAVQGPLSRALEDVMDLCHKLTIWSISAEGADDLPVANSLRALLSGRCTRHLVLSLGLAALCAADGGPSYGLPPELLLRLPIFGSESGNEDIRHRHGVQELQGDVLCTLMCMLSAVGHEPRPPPPPGKRSALTLLLRVGRQAVTSGSVWTETAEGIRTALSSSAAAAEQRLAGHNATPAAGLNGGSGRSGCEGSGGGGGDPSGSTGGGSSSGARESRGQGGSSGGGRAATGGQAASVPLRLVLPLTSVTSSAVMALPADALLPPSPPPAVAAALAGGLLPCLEHHLRRAGEAPEQHAARFTNTLLSRKKLTWLILAPLMAYGDPRQAAALLATARKLLCARVKPHLLMALGTGGPLCGENAAGCRLGASLLAWMHSVLGHAAGSGVWGTPGANGGADELAAAGAGAPLRQLPGMVSYAVCEWLPLMSALVREAAPAPPGATGPAVDAVCSCTDSLLCWVPVLVRWALSRGGQPGTAAAAGARDVGGGPAGGWRRLLLGDVCAVPLLGAIVGLLPLLLSRVRDSRSAEEVCLRLAEGCCCVAAAFPQEVRRAALEAAAADRSAAVMGRGAAAPRSGGPRGGDDGVGRDGGAVAGLGSGAAPGALSGGWRPSVLLALAARLRAAQGGRKAAAAMEDLAGRLARWCAADSARGGGEGESAGVIPSLVRLRPVESARGLLPAPAEARSLLRTCAHPACANLAGGSEAELPLQACGGCGAAWYCSRECQAGHWRAGHREACVRRAHGGGG
ncbi:hypothetical protein TSOC_011154 [Tetrabaena socialis]|uniref:phytol kinase n=1 Tax=Tetrabaena socialis TaxID=47790 RepID=A0A2J7ZRC8_9CHLO|nr:hypothetical protein TSOC_011154 [Tetrabaena socialis]|eukprot:PNH02831.1 hypothetical protein TSOC_011154 [Tetrabaena socialis]